jgi:hypothetical protein
MPSKFKLLLFFVCVLWTACKQSNKNTADIAKGGNPSATDSNKHKVIDIPDTDTIFKDPNVIVIGSKLDHGEDAVKYVAVKFNPYIRFSDFTVNVEDGHQKAPIRYSSNPLAKQFKTRITKTYKSTGVNFGGHYCFVDWGCGSPCQQSVLVDVNTGIVYDAPDGSLGYLFKRNSRMIIVNPLDSAEFYLINVGYEQPLIYIWSEKSKKFEQR